MSRITKPGLYPEMSSDDYHADPCPTPALSQSIAKVLLDRSPLHAWHQHPRLNPRFERNEETKFDVGNVAHKLMIGRGKDIVPLPFDDWRTKAAKEARDAYAGQGKLAVLEKQFARASAMAGAAREQLKLRGLDHLFAEGAGEVVACWREGDVWFRQMIDWLDMPRGIFVDFKTTDLSAAGHNLSGMMSNAGWPIQAAMAQRGLDVLDPDRAGRRRYLFVVQEASLPYALQVVELTPGVLTMGRKMLDMAVDIWRHCMTENRWPGYPQEILRPELPGWVEQKWLDREIATAGKARVSGDFEDLTMAG